MRRFSSEPSRGRALLWLCIAVLALAIGVLFWLGQLDKDGTPRERASLKAALTLIGERIYRVEQRIRNFDPGAYERRLTKLETNVDARFAEARKKADAAASVAAARFRLEFGRRHGDVEARLARLEDDWQADRSQLASLQGELTRVREQLANQESRMMAAEHNGSQDKAIVEQTLDQRIAQVRREIVGNQRELDKLARGIALRRVDFEVSKNQSRELVPGVSLHVTGIDVRRRQLKGWMWVMPDRKTVWLRKQNAMQPVIFYSRIDGKKREVVFTHVNKVSVVGYVLLPETASTEVTANASRATTANAGG